MRRVVYEGIQFSGDRRRLERDEDWGRSSRAGSSGAGDLHRKKSTEISQACLGASTLALSPHPDAAHQQTQIVYRVAERPVEIDRPAHFSLANTIRNLLHNHCQLRDGVGLGHGRRPAQRTRRRDKGVAIRWSLGATDQLIERIQVLGGFNEIELQELRRSVHALGEKWLVRRFETSGRPEDSALVLRVVQRVSPSRRIHYKTQFLHRRHESHEYRATHNRVPDIELLDFGNRGDGGEVANRKPVSRVHRESAFASVPGALGQGL